jgi:serine/threonine protein kinase
MPSSMQSSSEAVCRQPARLAKDFAWSSTGKRHVDYGPDEAFEGSNAEFRGYHHLGEGGQGTVTVVKVKGQLMARKSINIENVNDECKREAIILESVNHRHIIQLIGSYTWSGRYHLLFYPVADYNLKQLMARDQALRNEEWESQIKESFGCLAGAVTFLHSKKVAIKHKDIKPSNILFVSGKPILADFGLSNSFKGKENSFSIGGTGKSPLYAAPEVITETKRGSSQDIFSLGLVFQDMYWSLQGRTEARPSDENGNLRQSPFRGIELSLAELDFCRKLGKYVFDEDKLLQERATLMTIFRGMLSRNPEDRPRADDLWYFFRRSSTCFGKSCGDCCLDSDATVNTTFRPWSGLTEYDAARPFDDPLQERLRLEDDAIRSEEDVTVIMNRVSPEFDWSGRGQFHIDGIPEQEVPLTVVSVLGRGGSAYVDAVMCKEKLLARKSMHLRGTVNATRQRREFFKEVDIIRRLQHPHMVQIVGSYESGRTVSILTTPVCELDLSAFMGECRMVAEDPTRKALARRNKMSLKRSMACLVQGLEYLHDHFIRHKDIKPSNILVKKGTDYIHMYYTDFGISYDFSDAGLSTTTGPTSMTKRYASPEVLRYEPRNTSSDIFSLGCVFLEMQSVILGTSLPESESPYHAYAQELDLINRFIAGKLLQHSGVVQGQRFPRKHLRTVLDLIARMLSAEAKLRPTASDAVHVLGSNECCHLDVEGPSEDRTIWEGTVEDRTIQQI